MNKSEKTIKKERENLNEMLENATVVLMATNKAVGVIGEPSAILAAYGTLTDRLLHGGFPEESLKAMFNACLKVNGKGHIFETLPKDILEKLRNDLNEFLGDSADE